MSPGEKLSLADSLWDVVWSATQAGVRMRHPDLRHPSTLSSTRCCSVSKAQAFGMFTTLSACCGYSGIPWTIHDCATTLSRLASRRNGMK